MEYTLNTINDHSDDALEFARWLGREGFIQTRNRHCRACGGELKLEASAVFAQDGVAMRCSNQDCRQRFSVRQDSFFQPTTLSLKKQMQMMVLFCADSTVGATQRSLKVSNKAAVNFFDNCRGVWSDDLRDHPITFPDAGEFEVDECKIQRVHDQKLNVYFNQWVGGIYHRETRRVLLYRLPNRSAAVMIPPVLNHVPLHSFVYSDEHASYFQLRDHNYEHYTVNHSAGEYERDEDVGGGEIIHVHINSMEGIFSLVRRRLAYKSRRNVNRIDIILQEIMYRRSGRSLFDPFKWFRE